jgi:hypothetical protein
MLDIRRERGPRANDTDGECRSSVSDTDGCAERHGHGHRRADGHADEGAHTDTHTDRNDRADDRDGGTRAGGPGDRG